MLKTGCQELKKYIQLPYSYSHQRFNQWDQFMLLNQHCCLRKGAETVFVIATYEHKYTYTCLVIFFCCCKSQGPICCLLWSVWNKVHNNSFWINSIARFLEVTITKGFKNWCRDTVKKTIPRCCMVFFKPYYDSFWIHILINSATVTRAFVVRNPLSLVLHM